MKPRIQWNKTLSCWECEGIRKGYGHASCQFGTSPSKAYGNWLRSYNNKPFVFPRIETFHDKIVRELMRQRAHQGIAT